MPIETGYSLVGRCMRALKEKAGVKTSGCMRGCETFSGRINKQTRSIHGSLQEGTVYVRALDRRAEVVG
jgi:hypothetical protein